MKIEIKKERDTPLLSRKRVTLMAEYEGATPSRTDIRKDVSKKLSSKENLTIIKHVYTRFGSQRAKIIAHVYENEKDMNTIENKSLLEKHNPGTKKKKGEEGEEQPAESKAEAPKEEPKVEKKE